MVLTKTDYILWRECRKNVWLKIHRPEIYKQAELSEFEKQIIETGNEAEEIARKLFPGGFLIEGRGEESQKKTTDLLVENKKLLFQPVFFKSGFLAAADILERNSDGTYNLYEVKSTTDIDKKTHYHDLAFQVNLLENCGLNISKSHLIHLNSEYVRQGELNINQLFKIEDVTETVEDMRQAVEADMQTALKYVSQEDEPAGYCDCVYKGRSNHCATFAYSNPKVPGYGVHDLSRIGASKAKLRELIDVGIFELTDVPEDMFGKLTAVQQNQIVAHVQDKILLQAANIQKELESLMFPLYFLDYETFPCAIPKFDGFSPYQQIPFQYSLYRVDAPEAKPAHAEFIFTRQGDPSAEFAASLKKDIGGQGSVIVWNKGFECKINNEIAKRLPQEKDFIESANARVYDLMEIFSKQLYVHKEFRGRVSIKKVLPVLVPELSYKDLEIQEGGTASQQWNEAVYGQLPPAEQERVFNALKMYCGLDTYAMLAIWKHLCELVS